MPPVFISEAERMATQPYPWENLLPGGGPVEPMSGPGWWDQFLSGEDEFGRSEYERNLFAWIDTQMFPDQAMALLGWPQGVNHPRAAKEWFEGYVSDWTEEQPGYRDAGGIWRATGPRRLVRVPGTTRPQPGAAGTVQVSPWDMRTIAAQAVLQSWWQQNFLPLPPPELIVPLILAGQTAMDPRAFAEYEATGEVPEWYVAELRAVGWDDVMLGQMLGTQPVPPPPDLTPPPPSSEPLPDTTLPVRCFDSSGAEILCDSPPPPDGSEPPVLTVIPPGAPPTDPPPGGPLVPPIATGNGGLFGLSREATIAAAVVAILLLTSRR